MGIILQNDYLIPFFSVFQNIELASQIQNLNQNLLIECLKFQVGLSSMI